MNKNKKYVMLGFMFDLYYNEKYKCWEMYEWVSKTNKLKPLFNYIKYNSLKAFIRIIRKHNIEGVKFRLWYLVNNNMSPQFNMITRKQKHPYYMGYLNGKGKVVIKCHT